MKNVYNGPDFIREIKRERRLNYLESLLENIDPSFDGAKEYRLSIMKEINRINKNSRKGVITIVNIDNSDLLNTIKKLYFDKH